MIAQQDRTIIAAIYARTSSPNQRFNYSIEGQVNECWDYCEDRKWIVKYVFVDESQRAKTTERPRFQMMLERGRAREFQVIVFWKLDRFCRSLRDLVNLERDFGQWGVQLCSVTEFIDTSSAVGRFNYRNLASVAELESEIIGERSRLGLYGLAREHKWPNAHPPLGYEKREDGTLALNKKEVSIVRRIFKTYVSEKSMPQLAFKLNARGILTKKGGRWNARGVRDILINPIYVGKYRVAGVEEQLEEYRVVGDEIFHRAHQTLRRYKTSENNRPAMHEVRRSAKINGVLNKYREFLGRDLPVLTKEQRDINE